MASLFATKMTSCFFFEIIRQEQIKTVFYT